MTNKLVVRTHGHSALSPWGDVWSFAAVTFVLVLASTFLASPDAKAQSASRQRGTPSPAVAPVMAPRGSPTPAAQRPVAGGLEAARPIAPVATSSAGGVVVRRGSAATAPVAAGRTVTATASAPVVAVDGSPNGARSGGRFQLAEPLKRGDATRRAELTKRLEQRRAALRASRERAASTVR